MNWRQGLNLTSLNLFDMTLQHLHMSYHNLMVNDENLLYPDLSTIKMNHYTVCVNLLGIGLLVCGKLRGLHGFLVVRSPWPLAYRK
jgi:hypothetical protein